MRPIALFLLLLTFALPRAAEAGKWTRLWPQDPEDCAYLFSGPILPGDLTGFHQSGDLQGVRRICLNSPGGSLKEAYEFARLMRGEESVGTRIRSGDSCISACAIVFMFGQRWGANSPYPSRELEPGAKLGFHTPFPAVGEKDEGNISAAFDTALKVSRLLVNSSYTAFNTRGPSIPPEIVAVMLETPADKMTYIETVGELQLLGIDMTRPPQAGYTLRNDYIDVRTVVRRVCASSYVATNRRHSVDDGYKYPELLEEIAQMGKRQLRDDLLHLKIVGAAGAKSIVGVDAGPYHIPGLFSNSALLYCRAEFFVTEKGKQFEVTSYRVDFGPMRPTVKDRIPKAEDTTIQGISIGLIPMDRTY